MSEDIHEMTISANSKIDEKKDLTVNDSFQAEEAITDVEAPAEAPPQVEKGITDVEAPMAAPTTIPTQEDEVMNNEDVSIQVKKSITDAQSSSIENIEEEKKIDERSKTEFDSKKDGYSENEPKEKEMKSSLSWIDRVMGKNDDSLENGNESDINGNETPEVFQTVPIPNSAESDGESDANMESSNREVNIKGSTQYLCLMRKNFILKCRTPIMTFFEIFCPFAMVWILTAAFNATGVTDVPERTFAAFNSEVPGPLMFYLVQTGAIPEPSSIYSGAINSGSIFEADLGDRRKRRLQSNDEDDDLTDENVITEEELRDANIIRRNLDTALASPLPIPSLNHYVQMHKIFKEGFENTVSGNINDLTDTVEFSAQWGNLLTLGNIHIVSNEDDKDIAQDFIDYVTRIYTDVLNDLNLTAWDKEQDALEHIESLYDIETTWAMIDFSNGNVTDSTNEANNDIHYTIRMNSTVVPWTRFQITANAVGYDRVYQMYYSSGYLTLQKTVNDFFLSRNDDCVVPGEFDVWTTPMPTAAFSQNEFFLAVGYLLAMSLAMAFLFPVSRLIKSVVEEKESRMKQTLFILGVKPWAHWLSWVTFNIVFFTLIAVLVTFLLSSQIAQNSDKVILFGFIITFALTIMSFSFFVASFFSRAKLASILGPLLFFGTLLPRYIFFGTRQEESLSEKVWASLAPCTAFAFGAELLADLEYAEQGFQWWNIRNGGFDVAMSFNMMFLDIVLYMFLAWYLEQVVPSQYGVNKKFYFLFSPRYWRSVFGHDVLIEDEDVDEKLHEMASNNMQVVDESLVPKVRIQNLVKAYKKGLQPAVNNLNLSLYEDQITCLLGHNGAGKSTTMSVLTGLFPPTKGDCIIYNYSIRKDLSKLRESMGICPQHNVIFDDLSVYEHIRLFETIKGVKPTPETILKKAQEVDLQEKLHSHAKTLSGGQKRKLCVAMALCGEPKFVLFDEPTSGMDPYSRRATWELLRKKKKGRVTILTTHFMEEAELLADRIAVLSTGKLQCYGTNLFLKERFGLGYNLTLVIDRATTSIENRMADIELDIEERVIAITSFLRSHISGVELLRKSARELIFRFPPGSESHFSSLFTDLDENEETRSRLGIGGYGVSNTTLEEVFLRLADEQELTENTKETERIKLKSMRFLKGELEEKVFEPVSRSQQIRTLIQKRWTIQKRDKKGFVFQIVLPVLAVAIALVFLTLDFVGNQPPLEMSADLYHVARRVQNTNVLVSGNEKNIEDTASFVESSFENDYQNVEVDFVPSMSNTQELSQYMLDTYHDFNHSWRYQAYFFNDTITLNITQDWDDLRFVLENGNPESIGDNGVLTIDTQNQIVNYQFDLIEVANIVYSNTVVRPSTPVDMSVVTRALHLAATALNINQLHEIIDLATDEFDDVTNVEELFKAINIQTGGSEEELDATYRLIFDSVTADFVNETMMFYDFSFILEDMDSAFTADMVYVEYIEGFKVTLYGAKWRGISLSDELTVPIPGASELETYLESIFQMDLTVGDPTDYDSVYDYIATLLPSESSSVSLFNISSNVTVMFNSSSFHAVAASYQGYIEYLYKTCSSNPRARLVPINYPLPRTEQANMELKAQLSVFASLFILVPFCYAPAAFIIFIVKERSSKSKHLQLVSGVDMLAFWCATYIWDMLMWFIFTLLSMVVFLIYGSNSAEVFVGDTTSFLCTLVLTFGYGLCALPFAYLLSRNFENHTTAQISVLGLFFVTGFIAVLTYFVLASFPEFRTLARNLRYLFRLWPAYNIGDALISMSRNFFEREVLGATTDPFDWEVCGIHIALLYGLSVPYSLLVIFMEYSGDGGSGGFIGRFLRYIRTKSERMKLRYYGISGSFSSSNAILDPDVAREKEYVLDNGHELKNNASVLLMDLWKVFPPQISIVGNLIGYGRKLFRFCLRKEQEDVDSSKKAKKAVQGLSTAVMPGDTFGLLGVNGAGKTTTMAVLTGDLSPTSGEAYVAGFDVTGNISGDVIEARKNIGFCPQIDPLLDLMTARETLTMFGKLRGIPNAKLNDTVNDIIDALLLTPHADKASGKYSGGNKRKLSLGIAIIGDPKVLFIDEASSGMDPVARRKMWELISVIGEQRSVILTTHSMEEAEALCSRIGIMIAGQMRCIGSVQHLKSTFLDGYTLDMQCKPGSPIYVVDFVIDQIVSTVLPDSLLSERHGRFLRFDVPSLTSGPEGEGKSKSGLGKMFGKLQQMKRNPNFMIENYSISQCSLEQVFISLVKEEQGGENNFDSS